MSWVEYNKECGALTIGELSDIKTISLFSIFKVNKRIGFNVVYNLLQVS